MQTQSVKDKVNSIIPELIEKFPEITVLYLFGSQVKGTASTGSDVDIAVCLDKQALSNQPLLDLEIGNFLEKHLGIPVDVVVMEKVSPILRYRILKDGVRLFERNPQYRAVMELCSFKHYLDVRHYQIKRNAALCYG